MHNPKSLKHEPQAPNQYFLELKNAVEPMAHLL